MFFPFIATIIFYLIIISYLASAQEAGDIGKVQMLYKKITYVYPKEEVIRTAVDLYCQENGQDCVNKRDGSGNIKLTSVDLGNFLPDGFNIDDNGVGGSFEDEFWIIGNDSSIQIQQNIPDDTIRRGYLVHYNGKKYGISPRCVNTDGTHDETTSPPCSDDKVYHNYPSSLEMREAIH